jgi:hypothetical protein
MRVRTLILAAACTLGFAAGASAQTLPVPPSYFDPKPPPANPSPPPEQPRPCDPRIDQGCPITRTLAPGARLALNLRGGQSLVYVRGTSDVPLRYSIERAAPGEFDFATVPGTERTTTLYIGRLQPQLGIDDGLFPGNFRVMVVNDGTTNATVTLSSFGV